MKNKMPKLEEMTLREKINQTIVIKMEKGQSVDFAPGAAFFFGQIITEADEAGLDELRGYVKAGRLRVALGFLRDFSHRWSDPLG